MAPDGNTDTNISSTNGAFDDDDIPPHLAQFSEIFLIENTEFDLREYGALPPDEKLSLPVESVFECQNWRNSSQENRDDAHLLTCEIVLAAIGSAGFDTLLEAVDETFVTSPATNGYRENRLSSSVAPERNALPAAYILGDDDDIAEKNEHNDIKDVPHRTPTLLSPLHQSLKHHSDTSFEIKRERRALAFMQDVVHSTAYSTDSADTVSEAVIKIYPHLCPAELAVSMLRFVRWTLCHEEPLETSFKSLGVTELQQTTAALREIEDRRSWLPIFGNERILDVRDKPQTAAQRDKFIFEIQGLRCAFCGLKTDLRKLVSFQFCNFYGRYGCNTCITDLTNIIPARIIYFWDFRAYLVSKCAKEFLEKTKYAPIYHPKSICPRFFDEAGKTSGLRKVDEYRFKISLVVERLQSCPTPAARSPKNKLFGSNYHQTRSHLLKATGNYSLQDFVEIVSTKVDNLEHYLNLIYTQSKHHCENCFDHCRKFYSPCTLCNDSHPVFPWYTENVLSCSHCGKCYHKKCCKNSNTCYTCSSDLVIHSRRKAVKLNRSAGGELSNPVGSIC